MKYECNFQNSNKWLRFRAYKKLILIEFDLNSQWSVKSKMRLKTVKYFMNLAQKRSVSSGNFLHSNFLSSNLADPLSRNQLVTNLVKRLDLSSEEAESRIKHLHNLFKVFISFWKVYFISFITEIMCIFLEVWGWWFGDKFIRICPSCKRAAQPHTSRRNWPYWTKGASALQALAT